MQHLFYEGLGFFLALMRTDSLTLTSLGLLAMQCVAKTKNGLHKKIIFGKRADYLASV